LRIGVTGHQRREHADWHWVSREIGRALLSYAPNLEGLTSLAIGADQIFAREVLKLDGKLIAVIPIDNYESFFANDRERSDYRNLLAQCSTIVRLHHYKDPHQAFNAAGIRIVDECEMIIAVWDGESSKGIGGTADIVAYAKKSARKLIVLNPIERTKESL